ncbi:hypothetical protein C7959_11327 [Orenia marismortui]|uniref:Uncharacterized protein n=1 Tax=Orenia marismortui TaxID=46469 RepID=A0A4R8H0K6_9FIRM|nr:hypothetical protein C7959_11327 [Orenia marismortui]
MILRINLMNNYIIIKDFINYSRIRKLLVFLNKQNIYLVIRAS